MTFWDHLDELRASFIKIILAFIFVAICLFPFKGILFDHFILAPSKSDFWIYKLLGTDFSLSLVNIEVTTQFMVHMKMTLLCAAVLVFPYIIFQIWKFIAPALYDHEKKTVRGAFLLSSILFYIGVTVSYFIVTPLMLNFFSGYQVSPDISNTFSLTSYISMFTSMVLIFGIVFEFPTVAVVLSSMGVLSKETLKSFRRHAICAVLILAALITPSGDPFSLLVVSVPLYMLYEFSVLICKKGVKTVEEE